MSKQKAVLTALVLTAWAFLPNAYGATEGVVSTEVSHRVKNSLGAYIGIHDPSPAILGVNFAYNPTDFLRLSAGYGSMKMGIGEYEASAHTIGAGVKGMVPGWNITPTVGMHFAHVAYSGDFLLTNDGFNESGSHLYGTIGGDWQTESGFNLNIGYRHSFKAGVGGGAYLGAGWFVDWLS